LQLEASILEARIVQGMMPVGCSGNSEPIPMNVGSAWIGDRLRYTCCEQVFRVLAPQAIKLNPERDWSTNVRERRLGAAGVVASWSIGPGTGLQMVHHPEDIQERTKPFISAASRVKVGRKLFDAQSSGFQVAVDKL
jgi:hypothetical protein